MGQPLYCSAAVAGMWGERGCGDGSTPYADSAVSPCFHGCLAFLHRHFPPQSPPSCPFSLSLCSQQCPCPGIAPQSLNSSSQLLVFPGDLHPCPRYVWLRQGLYHRSSVSLSALNVSPLSQTNALMWKSDPCFSSPTHRGQVQSF